MTIQWQPAPTNYGTFNDTLFEFFKLLEANDLQKRLNLHNVLGNLTIGIGFDLRAGGLDVQIAVFDALELDYYYPDNHQNAQSGTPEWIESAYITRLKAAVLGSDPSAVNDIMAQRAADTRLDGIKPNRRASFSFNNDTEVKNVFLNLWNDVYSKRIFNFLPALQNNADFNRSSELLALGSFAWNSGSISKSLKNAINSGNRAEAWYAMRYGRYTAKVNGVSVEVPGLVKRRFFESELFGLYDDPEGSGVDLEEAKQVYRMLQKHRADIVTKEAKYGVAFNGTPGTVLIKGKSVQQAANDDFLSMRTVFLDDGTIDTLEENLNLAKSAILDDLRTRYPEHAATTRLNDDQVNSLNIFLNPAKPTDVRRTSRLDARPFENNSLKNDVMIGLDQRDEMFGGKGDDDLIGEEGNDALYGGQGNDVLYGGQDNDWIEGEEDTDWLYGGDGEDVLKGGTGNDHIYGGEGNDRITGGEGNDYIEGGAGNDTYYINTGDGTDTIEDKEGGNFIVANGKTMKLLVKQADGTYKTPDGTITATLVNGELILRDASTGV